MTDSATASATILRLFPGGSHAVDGELVVGGCHVSDLAATYGTPLYAYDEHELRSRARRYREGLEARRPGSRVVFASKAFPAVAMYRLAAEEGLGIDVAGEGELRLALAAGVDPSSMVLHGNAKTDAELRLAIESGVGLIVIDNDDDVDRLERLGARDQPVLVRIQPGIAPETHASQSTGGNGSKFGLPLAHARKTIARAEAGSALRFEGIHLHIGSQVVDLEFFAAAVRIAGDFGDVQRYDVGGGLGVDYLRGDENPSIEDYLDAVTQAAGACLPASAQLIVEPGRSLVAPAGISLYSVTTVKRDGPVFVAVDGGMSDLLDVALTGQPFEAVIATRLDAPGDTVVEIVGRQCESGDLLASGAALPDPVVGDLLAIPVTGAYGYTFANNYNGALKPAVVFCEDGRARLAVRRETHEDLLRSHLSDAAYAVTRNGEHS
ncbi:diaminopimelate decarboxylase [Microbacterium sp. NPDC089695]|uniref:diaminopimelate decarboxylase n=1 Tax=Microbacterium sp. NPDC089695 TaxID=3364198 RepID=UPI0038261F04